MIFSVSLRPKWLYSIISTSYWEAFFCNWTLQKFICSVHHDEFGSGSFLPSKNANSRSMPWPYLRTEEHLPSILHQQKLWLSTHWHWVQNLSANHKRKRKIICSFLTPNFLCLALKTRSRLSQIGGFPSGESHYREDGTLHASCWSKCHLP